MENRIDQGLVNGDNGDNGDPPENPLDKFPALTIRYDPEGQQIAGLQFKGGEFKTWEFVIAVLGMADQFAELMRKQSQMAAMTQQAQEQAIVQNLQMGPRMRPRLHN